MNENEWQVTEGQTREGWRFCGECGAVKPPEHVHGDPLEKLTRSQLLRRARKANVLLASLEELVRHRETVATGRDRDGTDGRYLRARLAIAEWMSG